MAQPEVLILGNSSGAVISITTWIALVAMCLATFVKVGTKLVRKRLEQDQRPERGHGLEGDDYYFLAAMLFTTCQDIAASFQVTAGLGQHQTDLTSEQIDGLQKATYVAQLFYIPSLCLSRLAVLQCLANLLESDPCRRKIVTTAMGFNLLWIIIAIFSLGFQCSLPWVWAVFGDKCFNQTAFWDASGAVELLADLAISFIPIYLFHNLQIKGRKKISVITAFSARLLDLPLIVARLVFINRASASQDHAFDDFNTVLLTELHVNLAVIISSAPFLKLVMQSLQTGWITTDPRTFRPNESSFQADSNCEEAPGHECPTLCSFGKMELGELMHRDAAITTDGRNVGNPQNMGWLLRRPQ